MTRRFILIFLSAVLAVCCTREEAFRGQARTMQFSSQVESQSSDNPDDRAVFLFWQTGDYSRIGTFYYPQPYHELELPGRIDDYKDDPYNTGKDYPADAQYVIATGFSPSTLVLEEADGRTDYSRMTVPVSGTGRTDILTVVNPVAGSSLHPFDVAPVKKLYFRHIQSKISFQAHLASSFPATKYLRNVRIEIPDINDNTMKMQFVGSLKWEKGNETVDPESGKSVKADRYVPVPLNVGMTYPEDGGYSPVFLNDPDLTQLDPNDPNRNFPPVYIMPGLGSIFFNLYAEISDNISFEGSETYMVKNIEVKFQEDTGTVDTFGNPVMRDIILQESDRYVILILIDDDKINIVGRKAEWLPGGFIPIPVYPNK